MKFTAKQIANALTQNGSVFSRRRWYVVPNVSWGWGLNYEADLIAVSQNLWADEIEIKVNKYDLLGDKDKRKFKRLPDRRIKRFWYAVPAELQELALQVVPPTAGVIVISEPRNNYDFPRVSVARRAKAAPNAVQVKPDELLKLLHLGVMRYWDLRLKEK